MGSLPYKLQTTACHGMHEVLTSHLNGFQTSLVQIHVNGRNSFTEIFSGQVRIVKLSSRVKRSLRSSVGTTVLALTVQLSPLSHEYLPPFCIY